VVARLGGDEFAVIQVGTEQPAGADALARRLIEVVNEPFDISDQPVRVGTSIGIALAPKDGTDSEKLLKNADLALYRAKLEGRNVHRFFETEMDAQMQARRALELDLREAIDRSEFELYYQPVLCVASGAITGCEALIRWRHPVRGYVSPAEFIPIAEEAQLIGTIGQWVLREACREAATWPGDLRVAVNLSAAQFRSPGLAAEVAATLAASGLPPSRLELEITETVVMESASLDVLRQLHALGLHIALDDFGTGYSSLSYLRQFPFDRIKIDRSFVSEIANENTAAIVRAIVGLGTRLGAKITAEGVETEDQLLRVRGEGCTEAQGYLIGRPAPAAEFLARLGEPLAVAA
jgi:predicted signal transduction protein with EAL and GGDEF domain